MSSLPESYQPTLQTITTTERANKLSGLQSNAMKADDMIAFIIKEAQHQVINDDCMKFAESALATCTKKPAKPKGKKKAKTQLDVVCRNCNRPGHGKPNCYLKGGGKEGQGPWQQKNLKSKLKQQKAVVVAVDKEEEELSVFTCTSDYVAVANGLDVPNRSLGHALTVEPVETTVLIDPSS